MQEEDNPESEKVRPIPFNNLYLISGLVHGYNRISAYVLTIMLFIFGYLGYQLLLLVPAMQRLRANGYSDMDIVQQPSLIFNSAALQLDKNVILAFELGMFVFAFFGFYTGLRRLHHKPLLSVITGFERFRFKRFWFSFSVWGSLILLLTVITYFTDGSELTLSFQPLGFLGSALILLCLMPIQVGIEELIFRGYLVQGLSLVFKNGIVPLLITSLLFGLAHMSNPEVQKHGWEIMLPYYCLNAFFFGAITLLDEGLELAYGMHLSNNIVSGLLVTSPNSVIQPYTVFMVNNEDPQSEILAWLLMAGLTFVLFWNRYKWKNFNLLIK